MFLCIQMPHYELACSRAVDWPLYLDIAPNITGLSKECDVAAGWTLLQQAF
jgi:hypothetical protein